jgi:hypothetical protein
VKLVGVEGDDAELRMTKHTEPGNSANPIAECGGSFQNTPRGGAVLFLKISADESRSGSWCSKMALFKPFYLL